MEDLAVMIKVQNAEVSDTTGDATCTAVKAKKILYSIC
jgi:hypothetical protein